LRNHGTETCANILKRVGTPGRHYVLSPLRPAPFLAQHVFLPEPIGKTLFNLPKSWEVCLFSGFSKARQSVQEFLLFMGCDAFVCSCNVREWCAYEKGIGLSLIRLAYWRRR
jgi:hypothetical protein